MSSPDWSGYIGEFHARRPGITEAVLGASRFEGVDPYKWLADSAAGREGPVIELACGSAPLSRYFTSAGWVGIDRSRAELEVAQRRCGVLPVVLADGCFLPVADAVAGVVVCSMGLMVITPTAAVLDEIRRVLRPGGLLAALLPATAPLTAKDRFRYLRLFATLRKIGLEYPAAGIARQPSHALGTAGFRILDEQRARFSYPINDHRAADALVESLYLPNVAPRRVDAARRLARRWTGTTVGIPLQRVLARPSGR